MLHISAHHDTSHKYGGDEQTKYMAPYECTEKDFSRSEFTLDYYKTQKKLFGDNYTPLCFTGWQDIPLKGDFLTKDEESFYIRVNQCDPPQTNCAGTAET
jgi:hypothetical protein